MKPLSSFSLLCLLACSLAPSHASEALGRLFFTPEERQQMDRQLRQQGRGNVRINGYLLALPSGRATAWVDGRQVNGKEDDLQLDADDEEVSSITVTTPRGVKARARVGDEVNTETGAVQSGTPGPIKRSRAAKD